MKTIIKKLSTLTNCDDVILFYHKKHPLSSYKHIFSDKEITYIDEQIKNKKEIISIKTTTDNDVNQLNRFVHVVNIKKEKDQNSNAENIRLAGDKIQGLVKDKEKVQIIIMKSEEMKETALLLAEGIALANYTFTKHKTDPNPNKLNTILITNSSGKEIDELNKLVSAVYLTRDLINEPFSHMTAKNLADSAVNSGYLDNFFEASS